MLFYFSLLLQWKKIIWVEKSKFNFAILKTNEKILNFFDSENKISGKLRKEIEEKSSTLFEKVLILKLNLKS